MLAPKLAKARTAAPDSPPRKRAPQPSALMLRSLGGGAAAEQRDRGVAAANTTRPAPIWDFSEIPVFASNRIVRSQGRSLLGSSPPPSVLQAKLAVGHVDDPLEREADRIAEQVSAPGAAAHAGTKSVAAVPATAPAGTAPDGPVRELGAGTPLEPSTRAALEPRFGCDFSGVRVHTGVAASRSARAFGAQAYTIGRDLVFGDGRYAPHARDGQRLIAHELTHVVQQASSAPVIQRRVEMRDVGSGDQSGFSRLPLLIDRLNAMSQGLTFSVTAGGAAAHRVRDYDQNLVQGSQTVELQYAAKPGKAASHFETRMQALIDQGAVLPLRLTNRHGLLGTPAAGFHDQVDADSWTSGYVDIDDLLASSDLGLQSLLLHFLTERAATANYSRRIGTATFTNAEFQRVHGLGIEAEAQLLQDFFGDPTIHIVNDSPNPRVRRVFRNARRDLIRRLITRGTGPETGVDASTIDVVTHDGQHMTPEQYRALPRPP